MKWLKDDSLDDGEDLADPDEIAADIVTELNAALVRMNQIVVALANPSDRIASGAAAGA
ncbi:hypothetical protein [Candidatus Amarobacter glycogenicus]|uniref:hypothetical protein n=1 Tax=Candidatus Amarobacter glycogenicus TaxID=3140699 RepID=UPI0031CC992D